MNETIAYFDVDLEGRFERLRYEETNMANFVADFILTEYENVDIVLLNTGTLRSNSIMPAGDFTLRMFNDVLPMADKLIIMRISGTVLQSLLENSVSEWPTLDGRFAAFAGIKYSFDPDQPPGSRVHSILRASDDSPLDLSSRFTIVAKNFIAVGRDGYDAFCYPSVQWLNDETTAMYISDVVLGAFAQMA